jgi:hypothetical protein
MSIYEILPALDLTQSVHAKISIGMHRVVKFKISRIPLSLIGLETRLGRRTDRKFLRNPNLDEISRFPLSFWTYLNHVNILKVNKFLKFCTSTNLSIEVCNFFDNSTAESFVCGFSESELDVLVFWGITWFKMVMSALFAIFYC